MLNLVIAKRILTDLVPTGAPLSSSDRGDREELNY